MRQGELLRGTFHVGTQVLDIGLQLLVHGVLTLVVVEVVILYLRVLLPCVGRGALDADTEYEVIRAIRNRGITCIVVSHRLSVIRDCDEIVVLDHGKAIERGTHDTLMARDGVYTRLIANES